MKTREENIKDKHLFYRIVALWAVCEGMLGGIIHGFNFPGTGLLISSAAVVCISLIAWHYPVKGAILKATIIVAIFKMMLSPHSPPTAYLAVFFQGIVGELLFGARRNFKTACLVLAMLALVESAIQRILVMTIIYGSGFWKAMNAFISRLTGESEITNYSWYIGIGYVLMHLVAGIFVGVFAGRTASKPVVTQVPGTPVEQLQALPVRKKRKKAALIITWLALLGLYIQSAYKIGTPLLPASVPLEILIRSLLIIFMWYFIAAPFLGAWLKTWLVKKQYRFRDEVEAVVEIIPSTQLLLQQSWKETGETKGFKRLTSFARLASSRTIHPY